MYCCHTVHCNLTSNKANIRAMLLDKHVLCLFWDCQTRCGIRLDQCEHSLKNDRKIVCSGYVYLVLRRCLTPRFWLHTYMRRHDRRLSCWCPCNIQDIGNYQLSLVIVRIPCCSDCTATDVSAYSTRWSWACYSYNSTCVADRGSNQFILGGTYQHLSSLDPALKASAILGFVGTEYLQIQWGYLHPLIALWQMSACTQLDDVGRTFSTIQYLWQIVHAALSSH